MDSLSVASIEIRAPITSIVCAISSAAYIDINKKVAILARPLKRNRCSQATALSGAGA